jgi:hypothetical protein
VWQLLYIMKVVQGLLNEELLLVQGAVMILEQQIYLDSKKNIANPCVEQKLLQEAGRLQHPLYQEP